MRDLALAGFGFEGDRRHVAAQIVAGDVRHHVLLVPGGEHDELDGVVGGLAQAVKRGAQGAGAVGGHDGDADRRGAVGARAQRRRFVRFL